MMNRLWAYLLLFALAVGLCSGNLAETASEAVTAAGGAVETAISLLGVMCFWMGMMEIAKQAGLMEGLAKWLSPVTRRLFPSVKSKKARNAIVMNMAANFLGIGNAATPLGLQAMEEMEKETDKKGVATNDMVRFVVLNTASIQLLPTTLLAFRAKYGSTAPFEILPAVWIASVLSVTVGLLAAKLLEKRA